MPKNSPITSIQQLKGKKIAYGSGSSGNYNLLTVLTKADLTKKDVTLVNLQPAEALPAFTSVQRTPGTSGRPTSSRSSRRTAPASWRPDPAYGSPYSFEAAAKAAVAYLAKAAAIKVYLVTLDKAYVWAATHPSAWAVAWERRPGCPPPS